ncbi:MAG: sigma-70 family RNA polymerase sigma factor [Ruminococcus sp.]|uniref:sigma-70 family RNA polymerase sigma factor n=1 Tax=Ruminococcus sp. TaxID=41978 RepID=UPI0025D674E9|nr:sigma-70 family RNA polymerase sigma factor [Ruminococcus sp.]MCR5601918.1 sigma-70 family RNA polymerase sigma factor [Ruminococcus sp.]
MKDTELRQLMAQSVQKCHRAVFDNYCNYVYAIVINVLRSCGTREDIDDCVSDVFMKIYKRFDEGIDFSDNLKSFIAAVSRNTAIDAFRKITLRNNKNVSFDDEDMEELRSEEHIIENSEKKEQSRIIFGKIKELGEPDSTIIIQQYFYNRTAKEIADSISMTAAAVQKRSSRAKQKLKALLIEEGIGREGLV